MFVCDYVHYKRTLYLEFLFCYVMTIVYKFVGSKVVVMFFVFLDPKTG